MADEGSTTSSGTRDLGGIRGSASLRRLLRALLDGCIIGGVTLAPVMSILGFVGLLLPAESPWHHLAAGLLYGAVVWLCFSLAAAHLLRSELSGRDKCGATRQHGRRGDRPSAK